MAEVLGHVLGSAVEGFSNSRCQGMNGVVGWTVGSAFGGLSVCFMILFNLLLLLWWLGRMHRGRLPEAFEIILPLACVLDGNTGSASGELETSPCELQSLLLVSAFLPYSSPLYIIPYLPYSSPPIYNALFIPLEGV